MYYSSPDLSSMCRNAAVISCKMMRKTADKCSQVRWILVSVKCYVPVIGESIQQNVHEPASVMRWDERIDIRGDGDLHTCRELVLESWTDVRFSSTKATSPHGDLRLSLQHKAKPHSDSTGLSAVRFSLFCFSYYLTLLCIYSWKGLDAASRCCYKWCIFDVMQEVMDSLGRGNHSWQNSVWQCFCPHICSMTFDICYDADCLTGI